MTPEEKKQFEEMRNLVQELTEWKRKKTQQQLSMPLDVGSVQVLSEALRGTVLDRINVRDIFFQATQESPTEEGQMRFFNNRTTQNFRMTTTKGTFTGTVDLTAV
ncbi:TPA: hypothetical protein DEP58_01645 [Patescibacteria group bacterium]|nr:hypothetical protein [Patescibacteria group bacterium]